MLDAQRLYLALALVTTAAVGCGGGGGETAGTGGHGGQGGSPSSSSSSSSSSASSSSGKAPVRGFGTKGCNTAIATTLAVNQLYFGEGNSGEWKDFGFNIDGKSSTGSSKDLCQPNAGGMASDAYPDGNNGIDNSFGKNLLPTILSLYNTWPSDVNNAIHKGVFTALLKLQCVGPTGDVPSFTTQLFGGTTLGSMPKFDGTDKWPVEPELLSDPTDPTSTTITFNKSSVKGDAFDSGKGVTIILTIPVSTQDASTSIKLTLYAGRMLFTFGPDRKTATKGMLGGVLNTEEFVAEVKKLGALLGLCGGSLFDGLITQIRQSSDIMTDGTQDPAQTCDGISMGLGFDLTAAQIGDVGPPTPMGDSCP